MASVNKVILVGNLGAEPETRYAPSGEAICNIRVATTDTWRDKATGEKRESTEWHRVVLFSKLAEIASQYLKKGSSVYIEGRLQTRKWQDKEGRDQYTTEIRADQMQMLGGNRSEHEGGGQRGGQRPPARPQQGAASSGAQGAHGPANGSDWDNDIPFAPLPNNVY